MQAEPIAANSMAYCRTRLWITIHALGLTTGNCAFADDRYDEHPQAERFKIRIGGLIIDDFETTPHLTRGSFQSAR